VDGIIIKAVKFEGPVVGGKIVDVIPLGPEIGAAIDAEILLGPVIGIGGRTWQAFPFKTAGLRYFERTESLNPSRSVSTKHAFKEPPYLGQFLEYICSDVLEFFTFRVSCRFLPLRYAVPFAFLYFLTRRIFHIDDQLTSRA